MGKAYDGGALIKIAAGMKEIALDRALGRNSSDDPIRREQPVTHTLTGGARLELGRTVNSENKPVWRLRVSREGVFPSETEMRVFREAFEVGMWISDPPQVLGTRHAFVIQWLVVPQSRNDNLETVNQKT